MVVKKTALLLDQQLVAQVRELLGTATTTETVTEAMREVIRVRGRARHFDRLRERAAEVADAEAAGEGWAMEVHRSGRARGSDRGDAPR